MAQLPTPPASRQNSEIPDAELKQLHINNTTPNLLSSLDALLEKYLHLLDKHQRLQSELASKLSSGFLSLAHANYTCPPGRRYGADYYDERMKASRKVTLQSPSSTDKVYHNTELESPTQTGGAWGQIFAIKFTTSSDEEEQADTRNQSELLESDKIALGQEFSNDWGNGDPLKTTVAPRASSNPSKAELKAETKSESVRRIPRTLDPIRWYGILVPPSLRSAQRSFTELVEGSLPELAGVMVEMQATEKEVSRLRKELGRQ
ncbi:hypothetical protein BDW62DRAFT_79147 [Aspergillus aurantiobrunneus]